MIHTRELTILLVSDDAELCAAARREFEAKEGGLRVAAVRTVDAALPPWLRIPGERRVCGKDAAPELRRLRSGSSRAGGGDWRAGSGIRTGLAGRGRRRRLRRARRRWSARCAGDGRAALAPGAASGQRRATVRCREECLKWRGVWRSAPP